MLFLHTISVTEETKTESRTTCPGAERAERSEASEASPPTHAETQDREPNNESNQRV